MKGLGLLCCFFAFGGFVFVSIVWSVIRGVTGRAVKTYGGYNAGYQRGYKPAPSPWMGGGGGYQPKPWAGGHKPKKSKGWMGGSYNKPKSKPFGGSKWSGGGKKHGGGAKSKW